MRAKLRVATATFLSVFSITAAAHAANILALTSEPAFSQRLVSIDPGTAVVQTLANTNISGIPAAISAFDPVAHQFYFLSFPASGGSQLNIIDLASGSASAKLIANPALNFIAFEWDFVTRRIIALTSEPGFTQRLVSIDPATGASQTLASTNISGIPAGISTFDPTARQFYFLSFPSSGGSQLNIIDLASGSASTKLIANPALNFLAFEWDFVTRRIIALTSEPGFTQRLVSIDPATGASQTLASTNISGIPAGISTFDPIARQFYFLSFPSSGGSQLNIIDLLSSSPSAKLIANPALNFVAFELDAAVASIPVFTATSRVAIVVFLVLVGLVAARQT